MNLRCPLLFLCLLISTAAFAQRGIEIIPAKPEIGEKVTISFRSTTPGLDEIPKLFFSYSNLYEMPPSLTLERNGKYWQTSFVVPRYAKYASFYIQHGTTRYLQGKTEGYDLIFYKEGKPVMDTYLYKSYSLAAQKMNADSIKVKSRQLIAKELELYPDNYAAKLRQLANQRIDDKPNERRYLYEGLFLIGKKLKENPTDMGNVNQVTMGYLIMGQNDLMDTLKADLLKQYPNSEVAYEFLYEKAYKTKDEADRIKQMEQLLGYQTKGESSTLSGIHQALFEYYAKKKDEQKALMHARAVAKIKNPWLPKEIKELAAVLNANNLALDTAKYYAEKALAMVNDYPFGVVRYFPAYGYIPGYAANRETLLQEQKGEILSIIASIEVNKKEYERAEETFNQALALSKNLAVYNNLANLYEKTGKPKQAFEIYRKMLVQQPVDSLLLQKFENNYIAFKGSSIGFDQELADVKKDWEKVALPKLRATKINLEAPVFDQVYDMEGKLVDPKILANKVVVIDFWATWCVPCIEGFPYMQKVYDQYKNNKDLVFMVMNSGAKNSLKDAMDWAKQHEFTFPIYYNNRKLAEAFGITVIPSTFVIDKRGKIRYKTVGFEGPIVEAKLALAIKDVLN